MKLPAKSLLPGVLGTLLSLTIGAAPAAAAPDLQIDEVMAGAFGRPELQFIELRLGNCEPRSWAGTARLAFFDAADNEVGELVFPADPVVNCFFPGQSVLIATQALADLPAAPVPDFVMPPLLVPGSGKVCFQGLPGGEPANLCLSYGAFAGDSQQGSPDNAPPLVPTRICSLRRQVLFEDFSEPNFNEDFGLAEPRPDGQEILIPGRFRDVSLLHPFGRFAEALFNAGVTAGCGNGNFCPQAAVTRDQMAVFLLRAKEGPAFTPPACTAPVFADVPCSNPFAPWINELAARGITGGCGGAGMGNYCPGGAVTREQMAVFLLLTLEGPGFAPPACTVPVFGDVACSSPFSHWIHELAQRGVTGGCGGGNYCPGLTLTREQMAVFLSSAFALPVPSFDCSDGPVPRDDHGDQPANATPLAPGALATGTLETTADEDVFAIAVRAGEVYYLDASLLNGGASLALRLETATDPFVAENDPFTSPRLAFEALADETLFVRVRSVSQRQGRYQILFTGPVADDHGDDAATATPIVPGATLSGVFEGGDADVFAFAVQAGGFYTVEARGPDSTWLRVLDADGTTEFASPDLRFLPDGRRELTALFVAPAAGTAFVNLSSGRFGPYELTVRGPLLDGDGAGTPVPLTAGVPVLGELAPSDTDTFSFQAGAGQQILADARLRAGVGFSFQVLGTDGATVLATTSGSSQPVNLSVPATGTYFLRLTAGSGPSLYRVAVRIPFQDDHGNTVGTATPLPLGEPGTAGEFETDGDSDVFTFTAPVAAFYQVVMTELEPGLFVAPRVLGAAGSFVLTPVFLPPGTYPVFLSPNDHFSSQTGRYRVAVRGPILDDHGNSPGEAPLLAPGESVAGRLQITGDEDFFAFDAVAGQVFRVKVVPDEPVFLGLNLALLDSEGDVIEFESSFGLIDGRFTVPTSGRFFLRVSGEELGYRLTLGPAIDDDHGGTAAEATLLTVDGLAVQGFHQFVGDEDFFAFDAAAGETLTVETSGLGPGSDTVLELLAPDGATRLADDDGAGALASRLTFTFPSSGRYFIRSFQRLTASLGIYQIAVRRVP